MSWTTWQVSKSEAVGSRGMVAAKHRLAVQAGLDALERGGNAVDAAVTTAFAMGVVEPGGSGIGGGGMMVLHLANQRRTLALDFAMDCPLAATPDAYQLEAGQGGSRFGWRRVRDDANDIGYRAAAVPGLVRGLSDALAQFGTITLAEAIAPAVSLARVGFETDWWLSLLIGGLMPKIRRFPSTAAIFLPDGVPPHSRDANRPGHMLVQSDLADTLETIGRDGPDAFYNGSIARRIGDAMRANGGLISEEDLRRYRSTITEGGISTTYRGLDVVGVPGAAGCVTALQGLNILEWFDLGRWAPESAEVAHLHAETYKRTFADRYRYIGDPKQVEVPWSGLLSKKYAAHRAADICMDRATPTATPGDPWAFDGASAREPVAAGVFGAGGDSSTTHINVVDSDRNAVTLTQTLVNGLGSGVVIPGTGIVLNNAMLWVDPEPGRPNSIAPGKRGLNNMTPLMVLRDGRPILAIGAPGGARIVNAMTQLISYTVDHGLGVQAAMQVPRVDCATADVIVDSRMDPAALERLRQLGHRIRLVDETFATVNFSTPLAIAIDHKSGELRGGVDPFRTVIAAGI
jgi:gamma-glutamyltranspeptidase/glutathione hydrolase